MGQTISRRRIDEEAGNNGQDPASAQRGLYFGPHIVMGGQRFATSSPETFLFGGLGTDLSALSNFAMNRMPHPIPDLQATTTIKSFVNLKKSSVHLTRVPEETNKYKIDFKFDCDKECLISVYFVAKESTEENSTVYTTVYNNSSCPAISFSPGMNQTFKLPDSCLLDISRYKLEELMEEDEDHPKLIHPIVILLETKNENDDKANVQSQSTICTLVKTGEDSFEIKVIRQKVTVDGVVYILQEIFGIDHNHDAQDTMAEENLENTRECVVCMSDPKDTIALPCRHMCICSQCAEQLRYQSNKCPICRQPFHSLLQIKISEPKEPVNDNNDDKPVDVVIIPLRINEQNDSQGVEDERKNEDKEDKEDKEEEQEEEREEVDEKDLEKGEDKNPNQVEAEDSVDELKDNEEKGTGKKTKGKKGKSKKEKERESSDGEASGEKEEKRKKKGKSKVKAEVPVEMPEDVPPFEQQGSSNELLKKKKKKSHKKEESDPSPADD